MTTGKGKRIKAFKTLMEIAKKGSIQLHAYDDDDFYREGRYWPVHWESDLGDGCFKNEQDRQKALDGTLERLIRPDRPDSVEQLQKEKKLIRLVLDAGANPNHFSYYYDQNVFDRFVKDKKSHMALEIAKTEGFVRPGNTDTAFEKLTDLLRFYLHWKQPYPGAQGESKEKVALYAQICSDDKELVYTLFQKGIYPRDEKVFSKLAPIVLEKDPEFFNKKKQQVLTQMKRAKTPVQIFKALMGKRKEKN